MILNNDSENFERKLKQIQKATKRREMYARKKDKGNITNIFKMRIFKQQLRRQKKREQKGQQRAKKNERVFHCSA